ncbi:MAG: hypothetical protein NT118_05175 [Lentisphaerae bacterium]|nr:hypothetical protein [Lentisphaerota bacterium]
MSNITSIELFDCNCCYGRSARPAFRYAPDVQALEEEMDFCGISRALVFNAGQRFENPMERNSELSADIKHRSRLCPSWAALPLSGGEMPSPELFFAQIMENGIKALRFFPQEHHFSLDSASFSGLFELSR